MWIARHAADFEGEDDDGPPDGGPGWKFDDVLYPTNPRACLTEGDLAMVTLWQLYRGGGMGGGHLPDPGGTLDQAALMLDAFGIMSACDAELSAAERPR